MIGSASGSMLLIILIGFLSFVSGDQEQVSTQEDFRLKESNIINVFSKSTTYKVVNLHPYPAHFYADVAVSGPNLVFKVDSNSSAIDNVEIKRHEVLVLEVDNPEYGNFKNYSFLNLWSVDTAVHTFLQSEGRLYEHRCNMKDETTINCRRNMIKAIDMNFTIESFLTDDSSFNVIIFNREDNSQGIMLMEKSGIDMPFALLERTSESHCSRVVLSESMIYCLYSKNQLIAVISIAEISKGAWKKVSGISGEQLKLKDFSLMDIKTHPSNPKLVFVRESNQNIFILKMKSDDMSEFTVLASISSECLDDFAITDQYILTVCFKSSEVKEWSLANMQNPLLIRNYDMFSYKLSVLSTAKYSFNVDLVYILATKGDNQANTTLELLVLKPGGQDYSYFQQAISIGPYDLDSVPHIISTAHNKASDLVAVAQQDSKPLIFEVYKRLSLVVHSVETEMASYYQSSVISLEVSSEHSSETENIELDIVTVTSQQKIATTSLNDLSFTLDDDDDTKEFIINPTDHFKGSVLDFTLKCQDPQDQKHLVLKNRIHTDSKSSIGKLLPGLSFEKIISVYIRESSCYLMTTSYICLSLTESLLNDEIPPGDCTRVQYVASEFSCEFMVMDSRNEVGVALCQNLELGNYFLQTFGLEGVVQAQSTRHIDLTSQDGANMVVEGRYVFLLRPKQDTLFTIFEVSNNFELLETSLYLTRQDLSITHNQTIADEFQVVRDDSNPKYYTIFALDMNGGIIIIDLHLQHDDLSVVRIERIELSHIDRGDNIPLDIHPHGIQIMEHKSYSLYELCVITSNFNSYILSIDRSAVGRGGSTSATIKAALAGYGESYRIHSFKASSRYVVFIATQLVDSETDHADHTETFLFLYDLRVNMISQQSSNYPIYEVIAKNRMHKVITPSFFVDFVNESLFNTQSENSQDHSSIVLFTSASGNDIAISRVSRYIKIETRSAKLSSGYLTLEAHNDFSSANIKIYLHTASFYEKHYILFWIGSSILMLLVLFILLIMIRRSKNRKRLLQELNSQDEESKEQEDFSIGSYRKIE